MTDECPSQSRTAPSGTFALAQQVAKVWRSEWNPRWQRVIPPARPNP